MASDRTSQTGEATAGFVQRPTIPPRSRRVISHSPLEIAAEYRAIVKGFWTARNASKQPDSASKLAVNPRKCVRTKRTGRQEQGTERVERKTSPIDFAENSQCGGPVIIPQDSNINGC